MPPDPSSVYEDDQTVTDDELLYRMVTKKNTKFEDGIAVRGGSNAFQDSRSDKLKELMVPAVAVSVYLGSQLRSNGLSATDLAVRWGQGYGVVSIRAGDARSEGQGIVRWPTDDEPEHAMIFCLSGGKKTGGQSKRLARVSRMVVSPG